MPSPQRLRFTGSVVDRPRGVLTVAGSGSESARRILSAPVDVRIVEASAGPWLRCEVGSRLGFAPANAEQSYRLRIAPPAAAGEPAVVIEAASEPGLRYGLSTLAQVLACPGPGLPALEIEDWPSFAHRGVMLDVSRDRVPTMAHLLGTVDVLASLKINHLQLYTEHTFAYRGHEEVWRECSPITPEEVRLLDAHCRSRGVVLAANQNCFGHLTAWLRHRRYAPLAETHGRWCFDAGDHQVPREGPFSLCPVDPGSIGLVEEWFDQLLPNFSSHLVNIGCDETFDVGYGRSAQAVAQRGRAAVYFEFVHKVAEAARRRGFRPMFWSDMALHHPESIRRVPRDTVALAWGYEPDTPFGGWCEVLARAECEAWVCPGTSSWCSVVGRTAERRANLTAAAEQGVAHGARGYLITDWGDHGHRQQWPVTLHALAEGANAAWNAGAARSFDPRAAARHTFGDTTGDLGPWLDELGDVDREIRLIAGPPGPEGAPRPLRNMSALFSDLQTPLREDPRPGSVEQWRRVMVRLDGLAGRVPSGLDPLTQRELAHTLAVARLAAQRAILRRAPGTPAPAPGSDGNPRNPRNQGTLDPAVKRRLKEQLDHIIAEHRVLWLQRSRPGGLDHSCGYYQKILDGLDPD